MKKFVFICLVLCLLLSGCTKNQDSAPAPVEDAIKLSWEYGGIKFEDGIDDNVTGGTTLRTVEYLQIQDYAGVTLELDYSVSWYAYDGEKTYLGSSEKHLGNGIGFSIQEVLEQFPKTQLLRMALRSAYDQVMMTRDSGTAVHLHSVEEGLPELTVRQEVVADLTPHQGNYVQDGEAFGDVLFTFKANGTAFVYDIHTGDFLDTFQLGGMDKLTPHVNSASFSNQYYQQGDPYPLLYTSVYNNKTPQNQYINGACCVYRITQEDGKFAAQMVQVIRVNFTANAELWASPRGNSRPYGNFVVDTDQNVFYAFVPRDDFQTTRFFGFHLPAPDAGTFQNQFGCNLVTLRPEDIVRQFDVEYFNSPQGCCYSDGKIYSVEGFGTYESAAPVIRVVDVEKGEQIEVFNLGLLELFMEPETITVSDGQLYYISGDVVLRKLWFLDE